MRLATFAQLMIGGAAGFVAARVLMRGDEPPEQLPQPLRDAMQRTGERLRAARAGATSVLVGVEEARDAAQVELTQDYLRRQGREPGGGDETSRHASEPVPDAAAVTSD
ncbi:MAG: hypothetical protein QF664_12635 [Dehalococcoidia bacterium]|jgi:hypothetical protein|nr:hypothetical protein [Dehalococcoidia bacterium]